MSNHLNKLDRPLAARQRRSELTTDRLLHAAEDILRERGADAASLRAIAEKAGMSIGIVYRRFPDKDAVLRSVYMRFFERVNLGNRRALANVTLERATTIEILTAIVRGIAEGYRRHRGLLRALVLYVRTHPDAMFRKRAMKMNAAAYQGMDRILKPRGRDIKHPRPHVAIPFAISGIATMLQERIIFSDVAARPVISDDDLIAEATHMLASYLCYK